MRPAWPTDAPARLVWRVTLSVIDVVADAPIAAATTRPTSGSASAAATLMRIGIRRRTVGSVRWLSEPDVDGTPGIPQLAMHGADRRRDGGQFSPRRTVMQPVDVCHMVDMGKGC